MAGAMGVDYPYAFADLEFEGQRLPTISVRYKGNNTFMQSRSSLKRPLKLDLNRGFPGRKLGGASKLNLHNSVNDPSWMNEVLSYRLFREAGVPAPRTAYARVYVTVPGTHEHRYLGLYSLVENVDNNFARVRFGTRKGTLFKPVGRGLFEDRGEEWSAYRQAYDPKTPVSVEETRRVIDFCRLVSHAGDHEFAARVEEFLIVKSSLALSLGLVGALSIVRFRAAIKEPEELAFLFLAIGIGLGLGAGQALVAVAALVLVLGLIAIRSRIHRAPDRPNLFLTVTSPAPGKLTTSRILEALATAGATASLKRFDETPEFLEAAFLVDFGEVGKLEQFNQRLRELDPQVKVSCLDDHGIGA